MIPVKRAVAWLDLILAVPVAAVSILVVITANRTPRNVDAGAIAEAGAVLVLIPAASLLGLAGLALWKNWRIGWLIQLVAVVGIAVLTVAQNEQQLPLFEMGHPLSGRWQVPSIHAGQPSHPVRLNARRARSPTRSANPNNTVAKIIATYGCRQRGVGENNEYSLLQTTNAMSAEAKVQNTQYKPQTVNRAAAANDTKNLYRGDIEHRVSHGRGPRKQSVTKVSSGSIPAAWPAQVRQGLLPAT